MGTFVRKTSASAFGNTRRDAMPQKYRFVTHNSHSDDEGNAHLPQLLSTSKRRFPSPRKDYLTSISLTRFNRPPLTHLPPLPSAPLNDEEQKQKSDLRRREIYALNRLMREFEQEQFRQYCRTNALPLPDESDTTRL